MFCVVPRFLKPRALPTTWDKQESPALGLSRGLLLVVQGPMDRVRNTDPGAGKPWTQIPTVPV